MNIKKKNSKTLSNMATDLFNKNVKSYNTFADTKVCNYSKSLQAINERINTLHKQLTYWDLYHITQVVNNKDELGIKFTALHNGESLVINTNETFQSNDQWYSRGDVVLKLDNGEQLLIKSQNSGYYYPAALTYDETSKSLVVKYNFDSTKPSSGTNTTGDGPYETMEYQVNINNASIQGAYNVFQPFAASIAFNKVKSEINGEEEEVKPIIKFFLKINNTYEEIYIDYICKENDTSYQITSVDDQTYYNDIYIAVK